MRNIKTTSGLMILIYFSTVLSGTLKSQTMDYKNLNGWEFLKWEYNKEKVEKVLKAKGIEYDPGQVNQKQGPTTEFVFQDMETRLAYDVGHLYDIQQYKYFGITERKKADTFYQKMKSSLTKKYGTLVTENDDKIKKKIHLRWKTKYTEIDLYYRYNDKIMKGFEDETFSISVFTNEID